MVLYDASFLFLNLADFYVTRLQLIEMIDALFSYTVVKNHHEKLFTIPSRCEAL